MRVQEARKDDKKARRLQRIAACLLVVLLVQVSCGTAWAAQKTGSWYTNSVHRPVTAADLTCQGYDSTALEQALKDLEAAYEKRGQSKRVEKLVQTVLEEYDALWTQHSLAYVAYYQDVTDLQKANTVTELFLQIQQVRDEINLVLASGLQSPYHEVITEQIGDGKAWALSQYETVSDEDFALLEQEQQLVKDYEVAYSRACEEAVAVDGIDWTMDRFMEQPPEDPATRNKVQVALTKNRNERTGEIYRQLVQVRTEIGHRSGFDNYADYCYLSYGRDYTPEDSKGLQQMVKQYIVPVYQQLGVAMQDLDITALAELEQKTGEQIYADLAPYINDIDTELGATLQFLRQFHLYDFDDQPQKINMNFTIPLYSYGSAFVFAKPSGTSYDYNVALHEFGHFAAMFHDDTPVFLRYATLDVDEIQSQGLEALFCVFGSSMFSDQGQAFTAYTLYNLLQGIIQGCCHDELQTLVYSNPDMTLDEINCAYYEIAKSYGYVLLGDGQRAYSWVDILHTFQDPCYYISYAVSALPAIDLYLQARVDGDEAAAHYMMLSAMDPTVAYQAALQQCGLRNIFDQGVIEDIAEELRKDLKLEQRLKQQTKKSELQTLHQMGWQEEWSLLPAA